MQEAEEGRPATRWLIALVVASVLDLALTVVIGIAAGGPDVEFNPIMRFAWDAAGWFGLIGAKVVCDAVAVGILVWMYAPRWVVGGLTALTLAIVALNAYSVALIVGA